MTHHNTLKKIVSIVVIIIFFLQSSVFLYPQTKRDIEQNFDKIIENYIQKKYREVEEILNGFIPKLEDHPNREQYIWKFYLLRAAVYEETNRKGLARKQYQDVKNDFGIRKTERINWNKLQVYNEVMYTEDVIKKLLAQAINQYKSGKYQASEKTIKKTQRLRKDERVLGECNFLLGAIYEKKEKLTEAELFYKKAQEHGVVLIKGINLEELLIYNKVINPELYIKDRFEKAKNDYQSAHYDEARKALTQLIEYIKKKDLKDKEKYLGECYLHLGAVHEREFNKTKEKEKFNIAKENYKNAGKHGIESVEGIKLDDLDIYLSTIKPETYTEKKLKKINEKFLKAKDKYHAKEPNYKEVGKTLMQLIDSIYNSYLENKIKNKHSARCYLLLSTVYEKLGKNDLATKNYHIAIETYKVYKIDGVNMSKFPIYNFEAAKGDYKQKKFEAVRIRLEKYINHLDKKKSINKELLARFHLLLAAAYESTDVIKKAKKHYRASCKIWKKSANLKTKKIAAEKNKSKKKILEQPADIPSIKGLDLDNLKYYRKYIKIKRCKFISPYIKILAIVGVLVGAYLLINLIFKKHYILTVNLSEGVIGYPTAGRKIFNKVETVFYNYTLKPGYSGPKVALDAVVQDNSSGSFEMNKDHTLNVTAWANTVNFFTDTNRVTLTEGCTAAFYVKLSAQPISIVNGNVSVSSGDDNISIQSGSPVMFDTTNWDSYQKIMVAAADNIDTQDGIANIRIESADPGIPNRIVIAVEDDITLELCNAEGYDFSKEEKTFATKGDLYYDQEYFNTNISRQRGIASLGAIGGCLNTASIPVEYGYLGALPAETGNVYVVRDKDDKDYYIVFRVIELTTNCCKINWIRRKK